LLKLFVLLLVSIFLAYSVEYKDQSLQKKGKHDRIFTFLLAVLLATYCGLRTWWNDTVTYYQIYDQTPLLSEFLSSSDASLAGGYGFGLLNSIMKTLGFNSQDYIMIYAFLTVVPYVLFVRKYCKHFAFGIFLMFATGFYTFSFAAIKQCVALAVCLYAVIAAIEKRWKKYIFLIALAFLLHPYSIVYLIVPLMFFKPWSKRTYLYILLFISAGFVLDSLLGTIIDVTSLIGANYNMESFAGEGVNIFRVLVSFIPLLISIPYRKVLFQDSGRTEHVMFNLAMIHALIMFVGLFGTANYFARLANYFLPMVVVVLPWMLNKLTPKDQAVLKVFCIIGYMGYFYYEYGVVRPFDSGFSQMSLWTYLGSHF